MLLPIYAYGHSVLRKKAVDINKNYPKIGQVVYNMFETLEKSGGIGLAAPQIGLSIKLFIVDLSPVDDETLKKFKKVFINPQIIHEGGEKCIYEEGCLSIPGIHEEVLRNSVLKIKYKDENFISQEEIFDGIKARVILHEYDHLNGILYIDRLNVLKKKLLSNKLKEIKKGKIKTDYKMIYS